MLEDNGEFGSVCTNTAKATLLYLWVNSSSHNNQIKGLAVTSTPLYVVTDSLGNVTYNGSDIIDAEKHLRTLLK